MIETMIENRLQKMDGWSSTLVKAYPPVSSLRHMTWLGSFSWTQTPIKRRLLDQHYVSDYGAGWVTPADIARDYIGAKYTKRLRCTTDQWQKLVSSYKSQPLYASPVRDMSGVYLDLRSAYWQIVQAVGWDVDYNPGRYLGVRSEMSDFPAPDNKLARNTLVSLGLPSKAQVWHPEQGLIQPTTTNRMINLILWGLVQDVLHTFAYEMITKCVADYVHTDGYIIPEHSYNDAMEIAEEWGLYLVPKHRGKYTVRGVGDYDIGDRRSKHSTRRNIEYNAVYPVDNPQWLKEHFKAWSYRIKT